MMRKFVYAAAIFAGLVAAGAPANAANICISTRDVLDTQPQDDGKAIIFRMRNGAVWRNDLQGACPDLRFDGFAWTIRNPDQTVCEHMQSLRVLRSGQICVLGKFTQITPPRKPG
jgi:hypothetical protein